MLLDWRVKEYLEKIEERHERLRSVYGEEEAEWKNELARLEGDASGVEIWSQFYEEAKALRGGSVQREWATVHEAESLLSADAKARTLDACLLSFTPTESFGRYLDLSALHLAFNALPGLALAPLDYLSFLTALIDHHFLPTPTHPTRKAPEYLHFFTDLGNYVQSFIQRTKPLFHLSHRLHTLRLQFDTAWQTHTFVALSPERIESFREATSSESAMQVDAQETSPASLHPWIRPTLLKTNGASAHEEAMQRYQTAEEVEWMESWALDEYFTCAAPITFESSATSSSTTSTSAYYCPCCSMKLAKDTVWKSHVGSKKHEKSVARYKKHVEDVSWQEVLIFELLREVSEALEATKEEVEKKQARRPGEASYVGDDDGDSGDDDDDDDDDDDEDEKRRRRRMTKKNYPVGPDGNPLPYWLYRLQGLSHEFKCQICGNASYFGRKAFERHFSDARHSYGLKCLGIDNSKDFFEVTQIDKARQLHQHLTAAKKMGKWDANTMEEFEDDDGTVLDKATHDLLARQLSGY